MSQEDPLPFLLRLFDDPNPRVHEPVLRRLFEYGATIELELDSLSPKPSAKTRAALLSALEDFKRRAFGNQPRFDIGQLVSHKDSLFRGVIVAWSATCEAPEDWFKAGTKQPDRDQPWYHVLVDGSKAATYAAESMLVEDLSNREIDHHYLELFFEGFEEGYYIRNDRPWPSQS